MVRRNWSLNLVYRIYKIEEVKICPTTKMGSLLVIYLSTLLCWIIGGLYCIFWNFSPLTTSWNDPLPHFGKMWLLSLSARFSLSFSSHYSWVNSPSSTSQPLSGGTLSTTPTNFPLALSGGIINSSTFFRVVAIFPVGHFITTPLFYENLQKYQPLANSTPPTINHKRIHPFFIRNLAQGLVLKVPNFWTSFYQILVLKFPQ